MFEAWVIRIPVSRTSGRIFSATALGGGAPGERARTVEFFDRENRRLSTLDRANDQGERTPMMKLMAAKERLDLGLKWPTVSQTSGSEASSSLMVAVVVGGLVTVVVVFVI